jgi:hypothetical protein
MTNKRKRRLNRIKNSEFIIAERLLELRKRAFWKPEDQPAFTSLYYLTRLAKRAR